MECKGVQEKLSTYLEAIASPEEKELIEQHLRSCQRCRSALEDLRKTGELVKSLEDVDVPPWFKQRILSRIRAEESKRSLLQKLFYPLHVKVPIQALATVLIAVLVVYVFKSMEPEMKKSMGPAPSVGEVTSADEVPKKLQESDRPLAPPKDQIALGGYVQKDKGPAVTTTQPAVGKGAVSTAEESAASKPGGDQLAQVAAKKREAVPDQHAQGVETGESLARQEAAEREQGSPAIPQEGEVAPFSEAARETGERRTLAASPRSTEAMLAKQRPIYVMLYVKDVPVAGKEVENILNRLDARTILREPGEGRETFAAELKAQDVRELFNQLKAIGEMKEKEPSFLGPEGDVVIRIEVLNNP